MVEYNLSGTTLRRSEVEKEQRRDRTHGRLSDLCGKCDGIDVHLLPDEQRSLDDFRRDGSQHGAGGCVADAADAEAEIHSQGSIGA